MIDKLVTNEYILDNSLFWVLKQPTFSFFTEVTEQEQGGGPPKASIELYLQLEKLAPSGH